MRIKYIGIYSVLCFGREGSIERYGGGYEKDYNTPLSNKGRMEKGT